MPRRLKRDALWDEILDSEIFTEPSLFYHGPWWCVSFVNPEALSNRSFITIEKNIKKSIEWLHWAKKKGIKYPHVVNQAVSK